MTAVEKTINLTKSIAFGGVAAGFVLGIFVAIRKLIYRENNYY